MESIIDRLAAIEAKLDNLIKIVEDANATLDKAGEAHLA